MKGLKKIILVYVSLISMFAISFKVESNKNDNIVDFPSNDITFACLYLSWRG